MPTSNISAMATSTTTVRAHSFGIDPNSTGLSGRLFNIEQPGRHARAYARLLPRKARPDMALERDNTAERLARIDKLMAENKSTPAALQILVSKHP